MDKIIINKNRILIIIAFLIIGSIFVLGYSGTAYGAETETGKVNIQYGLNVRSGPGTSYDIVDSIMYQEEVSILSKTKDSSGDLWYKISFDGGTGYVKAEYIDIIEEDEADDTDVKTGTVNSSTGLNVRSGAGSLNQSLGVLAYGDKVTIVGEKEDSLGNKWYKIEYADGFGYVMADYIDLSSKNEYENDDAFEESLTKEGFPESYKKYLRKLHADYPNWVFKADQTGINWSDAVKKETVVGVNLVNGNTAPASWKSMEKGAYDFNTGKYTVLDSGNWVAASESIIKYYMDPRNFLNGTGIFQFMTHSYDSETQTKTGLNHVIDGTFLAKDFPESTYDSYADVLMAAGKKSNVNPYVLASMILVEQGNTGTGKCISGTVSGYKGYYNYFNIGAYAYGGGDAVANGLKYASSGTTYNRPWNSRAKSIIGGAMWYGDNYVENNKYTLYLKKFNVMNGLDAVGTGQYMTNVQGASAEAAALRKGYEDVLDEPMTFVIPVYKNMPKSPCEKPAATGNNNSYLKALSVKGYDISPDFDRYETDYELVVDEGTESITVSAEKSSSSATVTGAGTIKLTKDPQEIDIKVSSAGGHVRTYTITVSGNGSNGADKDDEEKEEQNKEEESKDESLSLTSSEYELGKYITGVKAGTSYEKFVDNINVKNGKIKVLSSSGKTVTSGNIATGMKLAAYNLDGEKEKTYRIVVKGDVNGDGKITAVDPLATQKHIVGSRALEGSYLAAADINDDGKYTSLDVLCIQKHIVGSYKIS